MSAYGRCPLTGGVRLWEISTYGRCPPMGGVRPAYGRCPLPEVRHVIACGGRMGSELVTGGVNE